MAFIIIVSIAAGIWFAVDAHKGNTGSTYASKHYNSQLIGKHAGYVMVFVFFVLFMLFNAVN
ncbi:MAG: hypothetical protein KAH32_03540 [Chlamydiia bacterium]|nr:hypothetical protein [Chlamydiia bacterium]